MKKILSLICGAALALGLVSCGDINSTKVDPNAMTGYWSYLKMDVSATTSGKASVITYKEGVGQSGAFGSPALSVTLTGAKSAAIIWDGKDGTDLMENTRTDCPTIESLGLEVADGEFVIFAFTPYATVNLWVWDDTDGNYTGGVWPGKETTATVEVPKWAMTVKGIKIVNAPAIGDAGYIAFCEAWVPGNDWGAGTPNKITSGDTLTFSTAYTTETEGDGNVTLGVQVLNPASDADFWADASKIANAYNGTDDKGEAKVLGGSVSATATKAAFEGKTVYLVITWADKPADDDKDYINNSYCTAAFVAE